ncbi:hypothetical protein K461DRAFT_266526 [Myriangium duriaei CBS 260.36]|uniref:Integral membrane protein n=1 Tax=Myriangium duriaei CBS 260.36 TaxID=1168546 RepID=A0A9P4J4E6_9PEZI|nr:hypothetical protein K461DRAFT_266526 [Myriangium duriaei CBS 260.36]
MRTKQLSWLAQAFLLVALPLVVAHGEEHEAMGMEASHPSQLSTTSPAPEGLDSYFNHADHAGWMYAHILVMTISWTIILPVAVFLSVAKSRLAFSVQLGFLILNAIGVFTSIVYDAKTPDLYPNNSHHKIGWAVTWIAVVWTLLGLLNLLNKPERTSIIAKGTHPVSTQAMAQYEQLNEYHMQPAYRWSRDSGHGTEQGSPTFGSRSQSSDSDLRKPEQPAFSDHHDQRDEDEGSEHEDNAFLRNATVDRFVTRRVPKLKSARLLKAVDVLHVALERFQLVLAFLAVTTGFVTWSGIFKTDGLLNGLAHWIKGGIFFWYGLLTLGRWMGAFSDFGWAWNVRPDYPLVARSASRLPSAEFTESFVIFLYGASNVFLEHLTSWGKAWSPMDLEHISITIMFFGGGLLGMAVESKRVRSLLNTNVQSQHEEIEKMAGSIDAQGDEWQTPKNYSTSLNPLPALVIFLLGLLMSSHHQDSMTSTMVHQQWGTLFTGFAVARIVTYLLCYLKPPTSYFPSRPPTELISSFCLTAGGLVFMASTRDVIKMLDRNSLHAMFVLTVTIGFTCLLMVWTVVLYGIKGWAVRREAARLR